MRGKVLDINEPEDLDKVHCLLMQDGCVPDEYFEELDDSDTKNNLKEKSLYLFPTYILLQMRYLRIQKKKPEIIRHYKDTKSGVNVVDSVLHIILQGRPEDVSRRCFIIYLTLLL